MTFEAAFRATLLVLGVTTPIPVEGMSNSFAPHTLDGKKARAWSYARAEDTPGGEIAVGYNIELDAQSGDWLRRFVAAHEACHVKLHVRWIKAAPSAISEKQFVLNELTADHCAIWVMGVQAGEDSGDEP
jgi:hypothetical protein